MWALGKGQGLNSGYLTTDRYLNFLWPTSHVSTSNICPILAQAFTLSHLIISWLRSILSCDSPHSSVKLWCEASRTGAFPHRQGHALQQEALSPGFSNPPVRPTSTPVRQGDLFSLYPSQGLRRPIGSLNNSFSKETLHPTFVISFFLCIILGGISSSPVVFPSLPLPFYSLPDIFVSMFAQKSLCQSPVSFWWELLHTWRLFFFFWCFVWGRWVPSSTHLPWSKFWNSYLELFSFCIKRIVF